MKQEPAIAGELTIQLFTRLRAMQLQIPVHVDAMYVIMLPGSVPMSCMSITSVMTFIHLMAMQPQNVQVEVAETEDPSAIEALLERGADSLLH